MPKASMLKFAMLYLITKWEEVNKAMEDFGEKNIPTESNWIKMANDVLKFVPSSAQGDMRIVPIVVDYNTMRKIEIDSRYLNTTYMDMVEKEMKKYIDDVFQKMIYECAGIARMEYDQMNAK